MRQFIFFGILCLFHMVAPHTLMATTTEVNIPRILAFWNGLTLIQGTIHQWVEGEAEGVVSGTLWLKKGDASSACLRLDYEPGYPHKIYVEKGYLTIEQLEDGSLSTYATSVTPVDLILKKNIQKGTDITVVSAQKIATLPWAQKWSETGTESPSTTRTETGSEPLSPTQSEFVEIVITAPQEQEITLTLYFEDHHGLLLKGWKVRDQQGTITYVTIDSLHLNDAQFVNDSVFLRK